MKSYPKTNSLTLQSSKEWQKKQEIKRKWKAIKFERKKWTFSFSSCFVLCLCLWHDGRVKSHSNRDFALSILPTHCIPQWFSFSNHIAKSIESKRFMEWNWKEPVFLFCSLVDGLVGFRFSSCSRRAEPSQRRACRAIQAQEILYPFIYSFRH